MIEVSVVRNWARCIDAMKRERRVHCEGSLKRSWKEREGIRQ